MKKINNIEQVEKILEENNVEIKDPWLFYRFWNKVDIRDNKEECWNWTASLGTRGYGQFNICGKIVKANRISYLLSKGDISNLQVQHLCNNRKCCNPNHLELGNQSKNEQHKIKCGRYNNYGENSGFSKLTEDQVREIHKIYNEQMKLYHYPKRSRIMDTIAQKFDVSKGAIYDIIKGRNWHHIYEVENGMRCEIKS